MLTYDQKVLMAQMIFNEKDVLFGDFGPSLTKVEKQEKWMEILVKLNSLGANVQDYKILRDNEWSNMKRATEKKLQTLKQNESKSEEEKINCKPINALDEIVLDVLGKGKGATRKTLESPTSATATTTLNLGSVIKFDAGDEEDEDEEMTAAVDESQEPQNQSTANTIPLPKRRKRKRNFAAHFPLSANYELMELRKKKLQLECARMELEMEKLPLECAKLELEIQLLQRDLMSTSNQQHSSSANDQPQH